MLTLDTGKHDVGVNPQVYVTAREVGPRNSAMTQRRDFTVYSTTPPIGATQSDGVDQIRRAGAWCDQLGYRGSLVYTDNSLVDPWLIAQLLLQHTGTLRPLVAVQPAYMHPYSVAKLVSSLTRLHGRGVDINWVAGGFVGDLVALGDDTPHDLRYDRLRDYATIVDRLCRGDGPVDMDGPFYTVKGLGLTPAVPADEQPAFTVSGSSPAGLAAARHLSATAVQYPDPRLENTPQVTPAGVPLGIRVGIIARDSEDEAWKVAYERFPPDRRGQLVHRLAMAESDSHWHKNLSEAADQRVDDSPFWMVPFENYKTFCPYLVGTYERIASVFEFYMNAGFDTFITDVPFEEEDAVSAMKVLDMAQEGLEAGRLRHRAASGR